MSWQAGFDYWINLALDFDHKAKSSKKPKIRYVNENFDKLNVTDASDKS